MSTQEYGKDAGWLTFAAMVMFSVGFLRIITAIAYLADSRKVDDVSQGLFGDNLWAWGLWDLIIAALALYAGYSLLQNGTYGRVMSYIFGIVVIVQSFTIIQWAPWFAAGMIVLGVLVIWAMASTSGPSAPTRPSEPL